MSTQNLNAQGRSTAVPQVRDRAKPPGLRLVSMDKVVTPIPGVKYTSPGGGQAAEPALKIIEPTPAPKPPAQTATEPVPKPVTPPSAAPPANPAK